MLSQKLQDDLMSAYQQVHEAKRGHAAGDSDVEKQASQLASDVRYKAKGKIKDGASDEEKKKVFMSILNASPASSSVKAMARQKLLGEEVEVKEGSMYGITKGDGMSFPERLKKKAKEKKKKMSEEKKPLPTTKMYRKAGNLSRTALSKGLDSKEGSKAQKRSEKIVSTITTKKEKERMNDIGMMRNIQKNSYDPQGEVVNEMGGMKVKPKPKDKNPQNMALPKNVKSGVNYQTMSQSHVPVGNIFNEKKMDPVGQEDKDIDNDGDHDSTDKYLLKRRKAISKAIAKKRGKVKEGFSAWRIDLDFNEQVKK
jgi:hypothetical protein